MNRSIVSGCLAALKVLAVVGVAFNGGTASARSSVGFGASVASIGDVDEDGVGDFAIGDPARGRRGENVVWIVSGRSFELLRKIQGDQIGFGASIVLGDDVDGDGCDDLFIAARGDDSHLPVVLGYSLKSGMLIWSTSVGGALRKDGTSKGVSREVELAIIEDVTGDGIRDVAFGTSSLGPNHHAGTCGVVAGEDGGIVWMHSSNASGSKGTPIAYVPSVEEWSAGELLVGSGAFTRTRQGSMEAFRVDTGVSVRRFEDVCSGTSVVESVALYADMDDDGLRDLVVTMWTSPSGEDCDSGVFYISYGTGKVLDAGKRRWGHQFGRQVSQAVAFDDIAIVAERWKNIVGSYMAITPQGDQFLIGVPGEVEFIDDYIPKTGWGARATRIPDFDGDGHDDLAISSIDVYSRVGEVWFLPCGPLVESLQADLADDRFIAGWDVGPNDIHRDGEWNSERDADAPKDSPGSRVGGSSDLKTKPVIRVLTRGDDW